MSSPCDGLQDWNGTDARTSTDERAGDDFPTQDSELNAEISRVSKKSGSAAVASSETVGSSNNVRKQRKLPLRAGTLIPNDKLKTVMEKDYGKPGAKFDKTVLDDLGWTLVTEDGRDDTYPGCPLKWNFSYVLVLPSPDLVIWSMGQVMDLVGLITDGIVANTPQGYGDGGHNSFPSHTSY